MSTHSEQLREESPQQDGLFSESAGLDLSPSFQDNREEATQLRSLQEAANNSPQVTQLKALQAGVNKGVQQQGGTLQRKTAPPPFANTSQAPLQLARLNPRAAVIKAAGEAKATPMNRQAITNDWIDASDEAATHAAWGARSTTTDTFYSSNSLTGGGRDRPPSIDLKVKPAGTTKADFIFHLPVFNGIPDMIAYLLRSSGIQAKANKVQQVSTFNLAHPSDFQLDQIEQAQTMDISDMTNHVIYSANSAEILAHDPNFLTDLSSNVINPGNQQLNTIRTDPRYVQALANKKAREAKAILVPMMRQIGPFLPPDRSTTDHRNFGAVRLRIPRIDAQFPIAFPVLSDAEKQLYADLKAAYDRYERIRTAYETLERELGASFDEAQDTDEYEVPAWKAAHAARAGFERRYLAMQADLTAAERADIQQLLDYYQDELGRKVPASPDMDEDDATTNKRRKDEDDEDGGGGAGAESKGVKKIKRPGGSVVVPPSSASSATPA